MEKKGNFLLFLIIIAVLTLIIAVLVSFILLVGINGPVIASEGQTPAGASGQPVMAGEPPDEAELATEQLLDSGSPINLKTDNPQKPSFAVVEMSIKYFNKVDGIKDVQAKIDLNRANMQEIVTTYFMAMDVGEFSRFEAKAKAKEDLKRELNDFLLTTISSEKDRRKVKEIVYDVVFSAWNYQ